MKSVESHHLQVGLRLSRSKSQTTGTRGRHAASSTTDHPNTDPLTHGKARSLNSVERSRSAAMGVDRSSKLSILDRSGETQSSNGIGAAAEGGVGMERSASKRLHRIHSTSLERVKKRNFGREKSKSMDRPKSTSIKRRHVDMQGQGQSKSDQHMDGPMSPVTGVDKANSRDRPRSAKDYKSRSLLRQLAQDAMTVATGGIVDTPPPVVVKDTGSSQGCQHLSPTSVQEAGTSAERIFTFGRRLSPRSSPRQRKRGSPLLGRSISRWHSPRTVPRNRANQGKTGRQEDR